jgi:hypothetical protein
LKNKNRKVIEVFLSHAEAHGDTIPEDIMKIPGTMLLILPAIDKRPEYCMIPSLADERGGQVKSLSLKVAKLAALAAGAGPSAEYCFEWAYPCRGLGRRIS